MTDLRVAKRNPETGASFRLHVRNVEGFDPEMQRMFAELLKALDRPEQACLTETGAEE